MIVKPCPGCGRPDAGCGCFPYFESECRSCGTTVLGKGTISTTAVRSCHKCRDGEPFVPLESV